MVKHTQTIHWQITGKSANWSMFGHFVALELKGLRFVRACNIATTVNLLKLIFELRAHSFSMYGEFSEKLTFLNP